MIKISFFILFFYSCDLMATNQCKSEMTHVYHRILVDKNYEKHATTYNLINKEGLSKPIFKNIEFLRDNDTFESNRVFCKFGIGYVKGDSLINGKIYTVVITFILENKSWKFAMIHLKLGNQKLKNYLDLNEFKKKKEK